MQSIAINYTLLVGKKCNFYPPSGHARFWLCCGPLVIESWKTNCWDCQTALVRSKKPKIK